MFRQVAADVEAEVALRDVAVRALGVAVVAGDAQQAGHIVGDETPLGGREPVNIADFTDDPSETIMLVEAGPNKAVPWTKPEDIAFDSRDPMAALGAIPEEGLVAVFFSQHTDIILKDIDPETLKALVTHRGGEKTDFWQAADRRRRLGPDA